MVSKLNKAAYQKLIDEDIAAVRASNCASLEREHIVDVLRHSVDVYYPTRDAERELMVTDRQEIYARAQRIPEPVRYAETNANNSVKVKLKPEGLEIHDSRYTVHGLAPPKADDDGYHRFQLWHFMEIFGPHMHLGAVPPFETDILVQVSE